MQRKTLWIKDQYLELILSGRKTVEVRVAYSNLTRLAPGDELRLNDQYDYQIVDIRRYSNFEALLSHENPADIAPDLNPNQLLEKLRELYPTEKEALGVLAFELKPT